MVKIQLDLTENQNKIVEMYRSVNQIDTKQNAIKDMIVQQKKIVKAYLKGLEDMKN